MKCGGVGTFYSGGGDGPPWGDNDPSCDWDRLGEALNAFISNFVDDPLDKPPPDIAYWPLNDADSYGYIYIVDSDGQNYDLITRLEGNDHPDSCQNKDWQYKTTEYVTAGWHWPQQVTMHPAVCEPSNCPGGGGNTLRDECQLYVVSN